MSGELVFGEAPGGGFLAGGCGDGGVVLEEVEEAEGVVLVALLDALALGLGGFGVVVGAADEVGDDVGLAVDANAVGAEEHDV